MATQLMDLDDYSLEHIFKHLRMCDQIFWACSCRRMQGFFEHINRKNFKHVTIFDCETVIDDVPNIHFLQAAGRLVKHLTFFENDFLVVKNYLKCTPHLEEFEYCGEELLKDDIMLLAKLPMLESVTVWNCYPLEGKYLTTIPKLKVLDIYNCAFLGPSDFIDMCEGLSHLKELKLSGCKNITTEGLETLTNHCKNLEKLTLIVDDDIKYSFVAHLPNLYYLHIKSQNEEEMLNLVTNLAEWKAEEMESLNLETTITQELADQIVRLQGLKELRVRTPLGNLGDEILAQFCELINLTELYVPHESTITSDGILALVRLSPKLKLLDISHSEAVGLHYFVNEAFAVLSKREDLIDKPFTFISMLPKQLHFRDQHMPPNQKIVRYVHDIQV